MIRLNNPAGLSSRPTSVLLGELAIAAGIAGHGLTLCFDGFPASVLCQIYGHLIRGVGAETVMRVRTQRDLKKLEERLDLLRVVVIESARLFASVQWSLQMASATGDQQSPTPTVLCGIAPVNAAEDPGLTLVLQSSDTELAAIRRWLPHSRGIQPRFIEVEAPDTVQYESHVATVIEQYDSSTLIPVERRDCNERVLLGLLAGASVIRSVGSDQTGQVSVNLDDYGRVRTCLQSPLICPPDNVRDELAVDMVRRANVYLAIKYGQNTPGDSPLCASDDDYRQYARGTAARELITRREVADLGNTRSTLLRGLVEHLKGARNGYDQYVKMGLIGRLTARRDWPSASPRSLVRCLKPWTVKQVRTHFDNLRRQGLITAERQPRNGPLRYALPEELVTSSSPFASLPPLGE